MNPMTISKKRKGVRFRKKVKKSNQYKQTSKSTPVINDDYDTQKKWQKNINIEFEYEFLNNYLILNRILE
jgi:hypothetical protein